MITDSTVELAVQVLRPAITRWLQKDKLGRQDLRTKDSKDLESSIDELDSLLLRLRTIDGVKKYIESQDVKVPDKGVLDEVAKELRRPIVEEVLETKAAALTELEAKRTQQGLEEIDRKLDNAIPDGQQQDDIKKYVRETVAMAVGEATSTRTALEEIKARRKEFELSEAKQEAYLRRQKARHEMLRKWFERESLASIVGAVLLLTFGIAVTFSAFTGIDPTGSDMFKLLSSAFLLILGYFFGQATSRKGKDTGE